MDFQLAATLGIYSIEYGEIMDDLHYWLTLNRCPQFGPRKLFRLLEHSQTVEAIVNSTEQQWLQWQLSQSSIDFLKSDLAKAIKPDLDWQQQNDCHILTFNDADYPKLLREIADPPPVLFVQGEIKLLNQPQLAIVGSRNPTPQGKHNATSFAKALGDAGLTITSGLALGIDGIAHQSALNANHKTIAVTGTGLDRIYPARHKNLAIEITQQGALVSEFPIGTGVRPGHFPRRNRIISGLSLGVLVVEAAIKSGSLISAHLSMDQGREVFAIPGSIHNSLAKGCHQLIREGVKLVETANDVIEELSAIARFNPQQINALETKSEPTSQQNLYRPDQQQQIILDAIDYENTAIDEIINRTDLPTEVVSGTLLILELEGIIHSTVSGYCKRGK